MVFIPSGYVQPHEYGGRAGRVRALPRMPGKNKVAKESRPYAKVTSELLVEARQEGSAKISSYFDGVLFFFKLNSTFNIGLKIMIPRSIVACSTD